MSSPFRSRSHRYAALAAAAVALAAVLSFSLLVPWGGGRDLGYTWTSIPLAASGYTGVAPNPTGTTRIDRDTEWWGSISAGGDIIVGNSSKSIVVTLHDCSLQVAGSLYVDNLAAGYKPISVTIRSCTLSLASSSSQVLLDYSQASLSGSTQGSSLSISNSTIRSVFGTPPFPPGLLLLSGNGYNLAKVQISDTTLEFLGRWDTGRTTIATAPPGTSEYSRFTADSYLRRLTFISTPSDMNQLTNPGFLLLGDSLAIQDSVFVNGFLGVGFTMYVHDNTFNLTCRAVYDPLQGALIENNTIFGKYCKTVDFFNPGGTFRNNTVYDSIVGSANPSAVGMRIIGNAFIRSHTGGSAPGEQILNNTITGIMYSDAGEQSLNDQGTNGFVSGNMITNVATGGIKVEPWGDTYTYQDPYVTRNVVNGFFPSSEAYPAVKIRMTDGGVVADNSISNGFLGLLLDSVSNLALANNTVTSVTEGLRLTGDSGVVIRDSTLNPGGIGIIFGGGNHNVKFISVSYGSVVFADSMDVFQYYDYADLFLPSTVGGQVTVRDSVGATVYASQGVSGQPNRILLHLFNQTQSGVQSFNPFTFQITGLVANQPYSVVEDGVIAEAATADANGTLAFTLPVSSHSSIAVTSQADTIAPAAVQDIHATSDGPGAWLLTWTAPGDNGMNGTAYRYDVRYSATGPITAANWANATAYPQSWSPLPAGSQESHAVTGFATTDEYWLGIRAFDKVLNEGNVSPSLVIPRTSSQYPLVSLQIVSTRIVTRADVPVSLTAVAFDSNDRQVYVSPSWTAANGTILANGTYIPWAAGYWDVCAHYANLSDCTMVTVVPGSLSLLVAYPSPLTMRVGDSAQLTFAGFDVRANAISNLSVSWQVSPSSLGSVSVPGVFSATTEGRGTITLVATDRISSREAVLSLDVLAASAAAGTGGVGEASLTSVLLTLIVTFLFGVSLLGTVVLFSRLRHRDDIPVEDGSADESIMVPEGDAIQYECPVCDARVEESAESCPGCGARFGS